MVSTPRDDPAKLTVSMTRRGLLLGLVGSAVAMPTAVRAQNRLVVRLGLLTQLSGPWENIGKPVVAAAKAAVDVVNTAGGVLAYPPKWEAGHFLEVVVADTQNKPEEAIQSAKR